MFLFFFLRTKKTKASGENEFLVFNLKQFRSLSLLQSPDFFDFFKFRAQKSQRIRHFT